MRARALASAATLGAALLASEAARAGTFDAQGEYRRDPAAIFYAGFSEAPDRYLPDDADSKCAPVAYEVADAPDALDGPSLLRLRVPDNCAERLLLKLPASQGSYRASVWMRHGGIDASIVIAYADEGLDTTSVQLAPTGRTTSDGWVELATNEFPVDGAKMARAYLRVANYAALDGTEIDGLEIVPAGLFVPQADCAGAGSGACGEEQVCIYNRCVLPRLQVPPLPHDAIRDEMVDVLEARLRIYYGGRRSRDIYLPAALGEMEQMRTAKTAWAFWHHFGTAIHRLHDWHTNTRGNLAGFVDPRHRLNACFIEGDGDRSHGTWPKDSRFPDVLVSHVGTADTAGLKAGDRLVAVDGLHPFEWASSLVDVDWGYHTATDPDVYSDFAEALGGPFWGGGLIVRYATEITVLRCDATGSCESLPETIAVADLASGGGGPDVACDNRPFYHFDPAKSPDPNTHYVWGDFFRDRIAGTTPEEEIHGMLWDTLYGGGDPNGWVNSHIGAAIADWKAGARGVILDHRAGNGGTLDAATNLTRLVRPPDVRAIVRMPIEVSGYSGPADDADGLAQFTKYKNATPYQVGAVDYDPDLPVALILHRDGSASDYLPYGMKGAPKVKLFGPHATSGAFSTFVEFYSWGGLSFQFASGDTLGSDGKALIGHGVVPDVVILPKQSDLTAGKDTLFEAALAWVRQELKP